MSIAGIFRSPEMEGKSMMNVELMGNHKFNLTYLWLTLRCWEIMHNVPLKLRKRGESGAPLSAGVSGNKLRENKRSLGATIIYKKW